MHSTDTHNHQKTITLWLIIAAAIICLIIAVGGATRLTDSGLAITEWQPISGIIPPITTEQWMQTFQKYQQIPEYTLINPDISLENFKILYWWEWGHRAIARLIAIIFLIPLTYTIILHLRKIQIPFHTPKLLKRLTLIFCLGAMQGGVGWIMVKSGLVNHQVDVSQYRLALHLTLAQIILAILIYTICQLKNNPTKPAKKNILNIPTLILTLIFCQIISGAFVAGIDAGLIHNQWPFMGPTDNPKLIPENIATLSPIWKNLFENPTTVQFIHRKIAYLIIIAITANLIYVFHKEKNHTMQSIALTLFIIVIMQTILGILTLISQVQIYAALIHQSGATLILIAAVIQLHQYRYPNAMKKTLKTIKPDPNPR